MAELTHAEWDFLEGATSYEFIDDVDTFKAIIEKIHPGPYINCRECFKLCEGYYPGEPHHIKDNPECLMYRDIEEFNFHWQAQDEAWLNERPDEPFRECDCNCTCMERH